MTLLLAGLCVIFLSGIAAVACEGVRRVSGLIGAVGCAAGCALGLAASLPPLLSGAPSEVAARWAVPMGSFSVGLDALSAIFLIPIFALSALAALYGHGYLGHGGGRIHGASWFPFNTLVASMAAVVVARNGVLFLVAWEVMAISSYFLVTHDDEEESVRRAGRTYFAATHLGTAFVFALFAFMWGATGTLDFSGWGDIAHASAPAGLLFVLAMVGFGTKAGFMPLHVWLPEAHPAAPTHVSAVMSGVMIKTGIYGLVRMLQYMGPPEEWWGYALIAVGAASGVLGVLYALTQHGLKSLLAYHSVENIGIIALGLGMGVLGLASGSTAVASLGFGGALLHVVNHAAFKGLLFLGAGAVIRSAGTGAIDKLGGLMKRMPWTGSCFLTGSAAIAGLPPLNGFVSEFMIFISAFVMLLGSAGEGVSVRAALPALVVIASLSLIGGLAQACFAKAFGIVFLGEPRSDGAKDALEAPLSMKLPMFALAFACAAIGLSAPAVARLVAPAVSSASGLSTEVVLKGSAGAISALTAVVAIFAALIALAALMLALRRRLLSGRDVRRVLTWDCGYAAPTPRMQYTASSFADPIVSFVRPLLGLKSEGGLNGGLYPGPSRFEKHSVDIFRARFFDPLFRLAGGAIARLRWLQHGNVHLYILYIAITLIVLLVWKFGGGLK